MKKLHLTAIVPLCAAALILPLSSCAKTGDSTGSISLDPSTVGQTMITLEGSDRGVGVGESMTLSATVFGPSEKIHYKSMDTSIATVDSEGHVTGVKPGFVSIHAISDYAPSVYGSYTLFVEPTYIRSLVTGFRGNDYANGVSFPGKIDFMMAPAASGETEEKGTLSTPLTFALQNQEYAFTSGSGTYTLPSFDLRLSPESTISDLIASGLGKSGYKAKNFSFASLALSSLMFYSQENTDAALLGVYQPISLYEKLASLIPSASTIANALPSVAAAGTSLSAFLETEAPILNDSLSFDTDGAVGIALKSTIIDKINAKWPSILDALIHSDSLPDTLKIVLPAILPESFKDIRFTVTTENKAFASLSLRITALKKSGSSAVDTEYHPLIVTLDKPVALAKDYFTTLKDQFAIADHDVSLLSQLTSAESALYTTLNAYNGDLYDTIHHSKKFVSALKRYNANTYPLLAQVVNTPLIPSQHSDSSSLDFHYGPYESFDVLRQDDAQKNILDDKYAPNAGDVFTLGTVKPIGDSKASSFATAPAYTLAFGDFSSAVLADYASLEGNTLTIKKLPTDQSLTLTITPAVIEGYVPLTYTMKLNKVSA